MASVTIQNVSKAFGDVVVLKEFNEVFNDKEFVTLLGPSGCGKTTMLRIIAGFEKPTSGQVFIGNQLVSGENTFVPPERRDIGMVFQSYAVWPHMTVFENVAYPLKIKKVNRNVIKDKVDRISGWPWAARWWRSRSCCCWTNRFPTWTPSCANPCALRSRRSRPSWASPWST